MTSAAPMIRDPEPAAGRAILSAMLVAGALAVGAVRLWLVPGNGLWSDESWTLMIVAQPGWRAFWHELWLDPNAPLYYLLLRIWTLAAGTGDAALLLPSLLFGAAAGVLPLLWRITGLSTVARACWGLMIACWVPGILFSVEARCYALLLLIATAQTIAFAAVLRQPDRRAAWRWTLLAALAMLTHYLAAFLLIGQAVMLLARWRGRAVACWPAGLALAPVAAWGLWHLPRLMHWATPGIAWYGRVTIAELWQFGAVTLGPITPVFPALVAAVIAMLLGAARGRPWGDAVPRCVVAAGLLALALAIGAGMLRPMLSPRYLTPVVPSVLLGLVLIAARVPQPRIGLALLLVPYLAFALKAPALAAFVADQQSDGWQDGAAIVAAARPDRLVFVIDNPVIAGADPHSLAQLGTVFLNRAGQWPDRRLVLPTGADDAVRRVRMAMAGAARPAILWYGDRQRGVVAAFPPAILQDPAWRCRTRTSTNSVMMACVPAQGDIWNRPKTR